jgi:Holliday junction DNA helicase RuvA
MFSRIRGKLVERNESSVLLDVQGLSYEIFLPPCVAEKVNAHGDGELTLEIYSVLNIDGNTGHYTFYGFSNAIEREFFESLISVASIGPKSAARAFSQQKARDIVAKLQGKVTKFLLIQEAELAPGRHPEPVEGPDFAEEALAVLLQLEYKRPEAEAMIRTTLEAAPHLKDAEALLAEIYRQKAAAK